jgi:hypothetical protein
MPEAVGAAVRRLGARPVVALLEQDPEIEGAVDIVALARAPVGLFCLRGVAPLLQEQAEVASRRAVAAQIGSRIGELGLFQIAALL